MRTHISKPLFVAVVLLVPAAAGCSSPRSEGRAEAERDLAAGRLCVRTYGFPSPWIGKYVARAKAELGVEVESVGDCTVDDDIVARAEGYNERMTREIDQRHGPGALARVAEAARLEFEREAPPQ